MAKTIKVLVNTGNEETNKVFDVTQGSGKKGNPTSIKAIKGARYHLEDPAAKNVGPENIRSKRVGKNLHVMLDDSSEADLIIEGYYDEAMLTENNRGLYGRAEDGKLYEYIPEDPTPAGLPINLVDGANSVSQVLGGGQVAEAFALSGLVVAAAGFNALGAGAALVGGAALGGGGGGGGGAPAPAPATSVVIQTIHDAANGSVDSGASNSDFVTNDNTVKVKGTVANLASGNKLRVKITGSAGDVIEKIVTPDANGNWTLDASSQTLIDGQYSIVVDVVTSAGVLVSAGATHALVIDTKIKETSTGSLTHDATNDTGGNTDDSITSNTKPTFHGEGEAGDTVKVIINGVELTTTVDANGNWTTPAYSGANGAGLPDGKYSVEIVFTDKAGNTKTVVPDPVTIITVAKTVAINLDTVTADDAINATEASAATTTITGKVTGDFSDNDAVTLAINNRTFTGNVNASGVFSISVNTADLVADAGKQIKATVVAHSLAGVTSTVSTLHSYVVDATGPNGQTTSLIVDSVTADNIINATEAGNATTTISGRVTGEFKAGDIVTVVVNGHAKTGAVNADGTFAINNVDTADLVNDPHAIAAVSVAATDASNNVGNITTNHNYLVDRTAPSAGTTSISVDPVTIDNVINAEEAATSSTVVTGKVTGEFKAGDVVTLTVNHHTFTGSVDASGNFSIPVDTVDLTTESLKQFTVTVAAHDVSNNLGIISVDHQYVVDTAGPTNTTLVIYEVTADNIINATEASNATITITGKVVGEFMTGDIVTLTVNNKPFTGAVAADGTYAIAVATADLSADGAKTVNGSIAAHDNARNVSTITAQRAYIVDVTGPSSPSTALSIDPVTADNVINIAESGATNTAVTGKVVGEFKVGDIVTLTVNNKPFTGTVNASGEFTINVTTADLAADTGKVITASIAAHDASNNVGTVTTLHSYGVNTVAPAAVLSIDEVTTDDIINSLEAATPTIAVTGKVTGSFTAGDQVTLTVDGRNFTGTVDANGVYSIAVDTAALLHDGAKKINATIVAHDTNNNAATITADHSYVVDTTGPSSATTVLTIDTVTADNIINITEASTATTSTLPITGRVTGEFAPGDTVILTVNGQTYIAQVDANGLFSKDVAKTDLLASNVITASIVAHDAPGNPGNITAQRVYTIDTVAPASPTTVLSIDPVTADNILNVSEISQGNIAVTGKVEGEFKAGDVVTLTIHNTPYTGSVDANGAFSILVAASDLAADSDKIISASIAAHDVSNNVGNVLATHDYLVDSQPPSPSTTTLVLDPVTADNAINATESSALNTTVSGQVSGEFKAGDVVTLTINQKPFTGTVNANGVFSISVTTADLVADSDKTIQATLVAHDSSNNAGNISATHVYQVDTSGPTSATTTLVIDSVTTDNVITAAESTAANTTVSGRVTGEFKAGDEVTLTINQKQFKGNVNASGVFSISVTTAELLIDGDTKIEASIAATDVHGNVGNVTAMHDYLVDTQGPNSSTTSITINAVAADDVINLVESQATTTTITGVVTGEFTAGDTVTLRINGAVYTAQVASNGTFTKDVTTSDLVADSGKSIAASLVAHDRFGNAGTVTAAHAYTVDTAGPTPSNTILTVNPVTGDDIFSLAEAQVTNTTITGSVTGMFTVGDQVTLIINNNPYTGTVAANGSYSISVLSSDLKVDADRVINASLAAHSASGNPGTITATHLYSVQSINSTSTVHITGISEDTGVSATDFITADSSLTYSGTVTGFTANGDKVKIELIGADGITVVASAFVTPTITSGTNATWSWDNTSVDGHYTIRATVVDISGARVNAAAGGQDTHGLIIDTDGGHNVDPTDPTTPIKPDANATATVSVSAITQDSGVSGTDFITNDNTLTYSGTVSGFTANGDKVKVELLAADGVTVIATAYVDTSVTGTGAQNGTWTWAYQTTQADGKYTVRATIVDVPGNRVNAAAGGQDSHVVIIDTRGDSNVNPTDPTNPTTPDANATATVSVSAITQDSGVSGTDFITNDNTLTYSGTVSGFTANGDKVKVELLAADGVTVIATAYVDTSVTGTGAQNGTWTWAYQTTQADGKYTVRATIVDVPGNRVNAAAGGQDSHVVIIDTRGDSNVNPTDPTNPTTPDANATATVSVSAITQDSGVSGTDFITNDNTLTYSGTVSGFTANGDKVKVELLAADGVTVIATAYVDTSVTGTGAQNGTWTWAYQTTQADGKYTVRATIVDVPGNRVNAAAGGQDSHVVIIDTRGDSNVNPTDPTNPTTPDANATATVSVSAITQDSGVSGTDFITNDNTLTYSGTVSGFTANGDKVKVELLAADGVTVIATAYVDTSVTGTGAQNGTWTWAYQTTQADGKYTVRATIVDVPGNRVNAAAGGQDTQEVIVDTTLPTTVATITSIDDNEGNITGTIASGGVTDDTTPGVSGTLNAALAIGETVRVYDNGVFIGNATASVGGTTWTFTDMRTTLINGTQVKYTVKVADESLNMGPVSNLYTATIRTSIPVITITSIAGDAVTDAANGIHDGTFDATERGSTATVTTRPVISGTSVDVEAGQTVSVTLNIVGVDKTYTALVQADGTWSITLNNADALALNHGNRYPVTVSVSDLAGHIATDSNNSLITDTAQPDIPTVINNQSGTTTPVLTGLAMKEDPSNPGVYLELQANDTISVTVNNVTVTGTINNLPAGLTYNATTHAWSLNTATAGSFNLVSGQTYNVGVTVTAGSVVRSDISTSELIINTTAPVITLDIISGDGYINAAEKIQTLNLTGHTTAEVGSTVSITGLDGNPHTGTVTAGTGGINNFSITILAAHVTAFAAVDGSLTATAHVTNSFGLSATDDKTVIIDATGPAFSSTGTATAVDENIVSGIDAYTAVASDSHGVSYSLKANTGDSAKFSINSSTGHVTLNESPNYEAKSAYTFTVVATDGAGNKTEKVVTMGVNNLNEAPVNIVPGLQTTAEDTPKIISGLQIADPDITSSNPGTAMTVNLVVGHGTITVAAGTGVTLTNNGTGNVTLSGTLSAINALLASANGVTYTPAANYNGSDELSMTTNDNGNSGAGVALSATSTVALTITAVNDAPTNIMPTLLQPTEEDTAKVISGLQIADVDVGTSPMTVTLAVGHGIISVAAGAGVTLVGNGTTSVQLSGSLSAINTLLASANAVIYMPAANFNGNDTLTMTTNDNGNTGTGGAMTAVNTVVLTVTAVNDAPSHIVPGLQTIAEDTATVIAGLQIVDPDITATNVGTAMTVSLVVGHGTITVAAGTGVTLTNNGTGNVTLSGTLAALNALLASANGVTYTPAANYNGSDELSITTNDNGNTGSGTALSVTSKVALTITAVNDAPTNIVPGLQTTAEDTAKVISGLQIADVDAGTSPMTVTLAVGHGIVSVAAGTGVTLIGNGTNSVQLSGSLSAINTLLASANAVTYTPASNFNGTDELTMTTNDGGNTGSGGALTAVSKVTLTVTAVNDAPVNIVPTVTPTTAEDTATVITGLQIVDVDAGTSTVSVSLTVLHGTITFGGTATGVVVASAGAGSVTLTGTVSAINALFASANGVIYTPAADYNGTDELTMVTNDNGNTGSGGALTATSKIALTVTAVNDAPISIVPVLAQTTAEDTAKIINGLQIADVDVGVSTMTVTLAVVHGTISVAAGAGVTLIGNSTNSVQLSGTLAAINTLLASTNAVSYMPVVNYNGNDELTMTTNDGGNTGSGGALTGTGKVALIITPVNDAPTAANSTITVLEDGSRAFAAADFGFADVLDGNTLSAVIITTLPTVGTLKLNGVVVVANQSITAADIAANKLVFTPAANANGTGYASIGFKVQDNGGTANSGVDTSVTANTLTINVTSVNDAPTAASSTITMLEDGTRAFTAADFGFTDADGNTLSAVIITTLPVAGTLKLSGVAVTLNQSIAVASLGNLVFTPAANANGATYASIGFKVQDNGGTANGGVDTSVTANTLTINVTSVNDAPTATSSTITMLEDGSKTFAAADFGFADADGNTLSAVIITTLPTAGTLKLSGVAVTLNQSIAVASLGNLVYTPAANANGASYASIGFKVQDNGGTANGGVDTSVTANTLTINVTAVNDAPTAANNTFTVLEGASKTFAAADFGFADALDSNTLSAVIITTLPTAGTLTLSGVAVTLNQSIAVANLGNLVFTPAANANGTAYASIGFKVQDNGGTANSGVDTSVTANTVTINVTAVNDAPTGTSKTITMLEDGSRAFTAADFGFADVDGNTLSAVIITTLPTAGTLTLSGVAVTLNQSIAVASLGNLVFTPAADGNGATYATIGFKVKDNGGTANGGVDTSVTANTLTMSVTAVNDAPVTTVPVAQTTTHDTAKVITGLSIADVDAGSSAMTVTLAVAHGTISVLAGTGVTLTTNGTGSVTLSGTVTAINNLLATANAVTYTPTTGYSGVDRLTMTTSDNGNTGTGGALTDVGTVDISVMSVGITSAYVNPDPILEAYAGASVSTAGILTANYIYAQYMGSNGYGTTNNLSIGTGAGTLNVGLADTKLANTNQTLWVTRRFASFFSSLGFYYWNLEASYGAATSYSNTGGAGNLVAGTVRFYDSTDTEIASQVIYANNADNSLSRFTWTDTTKSASYFKITGMINDKWLLYQMDFTPITDTLLNTSSTFDTTPQLNGTLGVALTGSQSVHIFDGTTDLGAATVTGTTWSFTTPTASVATHSYTAKVMNGTTVMVASTAFTLTVMSTPLVLDLNGDGVQTVGIEQGVQFDLLANGGKQNVGWVSKQDGLLAMDLNGDGQINSSAELFGDHTVLADGSLAKDGWSALAGQDTNGDWTIDAQDANFDKLRVWVDTNGNGVTDADELHTLADMHIASVSLSHDANSVQQNGNLVKAFSSYITTDGATHEIADVGFKMQSASSSVFTLGVNESLDLSGLANAALVSTIDMASNSSANTVKLTLNDVLNTANTDGVHSLKLIGTANDAVDLDMSEWTNTGTTVTEGEHTFAVYNANATSAAQLLIDQAMINAGHVM